MSPWKLDSFILSCDSPEGKEKGGKKLLFFNPQELKEVGMNHTVNAEKQEPLKTKVAFTSELNRHTNCVNLLERPNQKLFYKQTKSQIERLNKTTAALQILILWIMEVVHRKFRNLK